jgi:hypothetical protein
MHFPQSQACGLFGFLDLGFRDFLDDAAVDLGFDVAEVLVEQSSVLDRELAADADALEVGLAGDQDEGRVGIEDNAEVGGIEDEEVSDLPVSRPEDKQQHTRMAVGKEQGTGHVSSCAFACAETRKNAERSVFGGWEKQMQGLSTAQGTMVLFPASVEMTCFFAVDSISEWRGSFSTD